MSFDDKTDRMDWKDEFTWIVLSVIWPRIIKLTNNKIKLNRSYNIKDTDHRVR